MDYHKNRHYMKITASTPFSRFIIKTLLSIILLAGFISQTQAQRRFVLEVYQVSTSIGNCDGFLSGDSDPAWWWTGADINDECYEVTCNGCTQAPDKNSLRPNLYLRRRCTRFDTSHLPRLRKRQRPRLSAGCISRYMRRKPRQYHQHFYFTGKHRNIQPNSNMCQRHRLPRGNFATAPDGSLRATSQAHKQMTIFAAPL